jgi:hypothetical protein
VELQRPDWPVGSRIHYGGALPDLLVVGLRDPGDDGKPALVVAKI